MLDALQLPDDNSKQQQQVKLGVADAPAGPL